MITTFQPLAVVFCLILANFLVLYKIFELAMVNTLNEYVPKIEQLAEDATMFTKEQAFDLKPSVSKMRWFFELETKSTYIILALLLMNVIFSLHISILLLVFMIFDLVCTLAFKKQLFKNKVQLSKVKVVLYKITIILCMVTSTLLVGILYLRL